MASTPPTSSDPHGQPQRHESVEVNPRVPFLFMLILGLALAAIFAGLAVVDRFLADRRDAAAAKTRDLPPGYVLPGNPLPPEPRLEVVGDAAITAVRQRDHDVLTTYAWDNPAKTLARIPVDRAIDMLVAAGNGVPTTLPADGLVTVSPATQPAGGAP
jgi:hypothetical protein